MLSVCYSDLDDHQITPIENHYIMRSTFMIYLYCIFIPFNNKINVCSLVWRKVNINPCVPTNGSWCYWWMYSPESLRGQQLIQYAGLNTFDPAAVQSSNPCSAPGVCASVSLGDGRWENREHLDQEYCYVLCRKSPMGKNPAMYLNRFLPWITRTYSVVACAHHTPISHVIKMPLAEDKHTRHL